MKHLLPKKVKGAFLNKLKLMLYFQKSLRFTSCRISLKILLACKLYIKINFLIGGCNFDLFLRDT